MLVPLALHFVIAKGKVASLWSDNDWWAAFKYPNGIEFDYADAKHPTLAKHVGDLDSSDSPLRKFLEDFYFAKEKSGTGWIVWNDEVAAQEDATEHATPTQQLEDVMARHAFNDTSSSDSAVENKTCMRAHSKGVLFFDKDGGHLLVHSVPKFPNLGASYNGYVTSAVIYGQSFLYIHLSPSGVRELSDHIYYLWPRIQEKGCDASLQTRYPLAYKIATEKINKRDPTDRVFHTTTLDTTGSQSILVVTKPCGRVESIFEDIAQKELKQQILVESWIRGEEILPTAYVRNVQHITGANGEIFKETQDHSKYFVTKDGSVVGIGDLNRMKSQWNRGGSFYILKGNPAFADSAARRVVDYTRVEEVMA